MSHPGLSTPRSVQSRRHSVWRSWLQIPGRGIRLARIQAAQRVTVEFRLRPNRAICRRSLATQMKATARYPREAQERNADTSYARQPEARNRQSANACANDRISSAEAPRPCSRIIAAFARERAAPAWAMGWPWCSVRPPGPDGRPFMIPPREAGPAAIGALYPRVWARARPGA